MVVYSNPYGGQSFVEVLSLFFQRMWGWGTGQGLEGGLVSDELQVIVLSSVAISSALVGTFLILRRMVMLANSISHTILLGIIITFILLYQFFPQEEGGYYHLNIQAMLFASLVTGIITTFLTEYTSKALRLYEDASNGLVFTTFFATGVLLATVFTRNAHIGTEVIMGNVDALHPDDLSPILMILAANILLFVCFFKEYLISSFHPVYAKSIGISIGLFNYLLMVQVSATVVSAFRAIGVIMVLALMVIPSLTARLWVGRLKPLLFLSSGIGIFSSFIAVALSRHLLSYEYIALSTGGLVVCVLCLIYAVSLFIVPHKGILWKFKKN